MYERDESRPWRVTARRARFYDLPQVASRPRKALRLEGDVFEGFRELRHFVHGRFTNRAGDTTSGYLRKADLEAVRPAPQNPESRPPRGERPLPAPGRPRHLVLLAGAREEAKHARCGPTCGSGDRPSPPTRRTRPSGPA